jgi:hypothetical protein
MIDASIIWLRTAISLREGTVVSDLKIILNLCSCYKACYKWLQMSQVVQCKKIYE